ncbi:hypothetical protein KHA80_08910 [Anaerobacillus sp. HL2]|nr:hypothetical protein KHA80_08910 [Anaerobacillus sp. HL2]
MNEPISTIEKYRFKLCREFATDYGVYLVFKRSIYSSYDPNRATMDQYSGNSSLAKGGTGDVLTGMVLALIMQQSDLQSAISNAIFLHGKAAEYLTSKGYSPLSVIASDLVQVMPQVFG